MNVQKTYALILGIVLTVVGIWGFFTTNILGISINILHTSFHLVVGLIGIYCGIWGKGTTYNLVFGWVFLILAVLGYIPGISDLMVTWLNSSSADNILHLVLGIVTLGVYYGTGK